MVLDNLKSVWTCTLHDTHNDLIKFVNSSVPIGWEKWTIDRRRAWWRDADRRAAASKAGLTRKRDRITAVEVWCEFYGHESQDLTHRCAIMLNKSLASIPGLERKSTHMRCGPYGKQRGFVIR